MFLCFITKDTELITCHQIVNDMKKYNSIEDYEEYIKKLDGIVEWFDDLLHKYQKIMGYSDTRINRLCILLNRQVNKLKKLIENS